MTRPLVQYGSKGKYVEELQEILNKWILKEDGHHKFRYLEPDGDFGSKTRDIVKDYQLSMFLLKDGIVGTKTWAALLGIEMYNCFDLPSPFVDAPNEYQCWAGATGMELRQGAPNTTQPPGVLFENVPGVGLGGLKNTHENMQKFANYHNLQLFKADGLSCLQLVNLVDQFGRLMLNIKGVGSNLQAGSPDDSHLLNLVGARGDGQPNGTTITLYNPSAWITGTGRVITASYQYLKSKYPGLTYQVRYGFGNRSTPIK